MTNSSAIELILRKPCAPIFSLDPVGKAIVEIELKGIRPDDDLTIDLYPIENQSHPNRHHGYWVFSGLIPGVYGVQIDLSAIREGSVGFVREGVEIKNVTHWINTNLPLDPVNDLQIVVRRQKQIARLLHLNLQAGTAQEVEGFYRASDCGVYHIDPFNQIFHEQRLRSIGSILRKFIRPGSIVLDAGSGQSIFYLLKNPFQSRICCVDLSFQGFTPNQGKNDLIYLLGSLSHLPFGKETFDLIFSGEVIEHLSDPEMVLHQFSRLLKPDGILVLTTPNASRLSNRIRGYRAPLSREHLNERNLTEWQALLRASGYEPVKTTGIYLELLLTYWRGQLVHDWLRERKKLHGLHTLTRVLMRAGRLLPHLALDLVMVARKR